ncbi:MAG: glucose/sorbosone dehydrogenase-like protein [Thermoleophilia bacterium]|nr:glucose/sorbosone dehydrogenase-like protein [Thermoleophilia bacterium]
MNRSRLLPAPLLTALVAALAALGAAPATGAVTTPSFRLAPVQGASFESPVWVGSAPGSTALTVAEQGGRVWTLAAGTRRQLLDLRGIVASGGEQGLLSVAYATDYRTSGRMFVYVVLKNGNGQVRSYRVRNGAVVAGSGRVIITVLLTNPPATNHNGGNLWATGNGTLWLSVGDGGGGGDPAGNAQRLDRLTGKLLRIVPRATGGYLVPRTNPYVGRTGARSEIYALGLRNPWRWSIDGPTGDIWIGDVGQDAREEIDRLPAARPAGANFGWRRLEGTRIYDAGTRLTTGTPYVAPFSEYGRDGGGCSITGGLVYRGPVTSLRGWYLYADFCTDTVSALLQSSKRVVTVPAGVGGIVHFGAGPAANVYVASQRTGRIYRIVAS